MDKIRFSVLIPAYNCEKYAERCISSVLRQSFRNFEIIIADDGSTDLTAEICESFSDERIRIFRNKNQGPLLTRAFAVSKASGEYCIFIDCDDYIDDGYFERLDSIISAENCDMVVCSFKSVTENKTVKAAEPWKEKTVFEKENADIFRKIFLMKNFLNSMCTKTVRTSILKSDTTDFRRFAGCCHGEDMIQSLYPVFTAEKIVYLPECWYNYCENHLSITHTAESERYKSILAVRAAAYEYFKKSGFFNSENRAEYSAVVIKSLMNCVKDIAASDISFEDKMTAFRDISSDGFYQKISEDFMKSKADKKTRLMFEMFSRKKYRSIISAVRLTAK